MVTMMTKLGDDIDVDDVDDGEDDDVHSLH